MLLPHEIVDAAGQPIYHCRACWATTDLKWFGGTSCPVCANNAQCKAALQQEYAAGYQQILAESASELGLGGYYDGQAY